MFYGVMAFGLVHAVRWGYRALYQHPSLAVEHLIIEGGQERTRQELLSALAWVRGQNIMRLNLEEVQTRVIENPLVAEASIASDLPDSLRIRIYEHQPEALLRTQGGIVALNRNGAMIGSYEKFPNGLDLPVIEGVTQQQIQAGQLAKGLAALATIRQTSLLFWDNLETLNLEDPNNMVAHLRNIPAPVNLGSEIIEANIRNFLTIADRIRDQYPDLSYIELGFPGQVAILPKSTSQE